MEVEIKQIIVVTDGRSNIGGNPVTAALEANKEKIIVNVIGIMNGKDCDDDSLCEVEKIAKAGGGVWENTEIKNLAHTMHAVTQKTINKTIETVVGKKLKEIVGVDVEDIPPKQRGQIIHYMDQVGEEVGIKCCVVMDCSGSMRDKMSAARQSILELMNSLNGRIGKSQIAVIAFPGRNGEYTSVISHFTQNVQSLKDQILSLKPGGTTPTAAAINRAVSLMKGTEERELEEIVSNSAPLLKENIV